MYQYMNCNKHCVHCTAQRVLELMLIMEIFFIIPFFLQSYSKVVPSSVIIVRLIELEYQKKITDANFFIAIWLIFFFKFVPLLSPHFTIGIVQIERSARILSAFFFTVEIHRNGCCFRLFKFVIAKHFHRKIWFIDI